MALPEEFNDVEHFQSACRLVVNRLVREDFSDLDDDGSQPNITTARGSLKQACLHEDSDSLLMTVGKLLMYYIVHGGAKRLHPAMYAIPTVDFQEDVSFRPWVHFYFSQDGHAVPDGFTPIQSELGFRLISETSATMTEAKAITLAREIKRVFAPSGQGYVWSKGKVKVTYLDKERGYDFRINALNKLEGETLIKKFLDVKNHPFVDDYLIEHDPNRNSLNNPVQTRTVYGKQKKVKRWRPTGNVRFRYAALFIDGLSEPVMLVDTTTPHAALVK